MNVIEIRDLWKTFRLARYGGNTLIERIRHFGRSPGGTLVLEALQGVTLDLKRGERVGVVGTNGSGKTTLMRIVYGIYSPTRGSVTVHGRAAALLQLGIGLIYPLTVRQNIFLYGAFLGLTRGEIRRRIDRILDFAEIAEYADAEVRQLSTGMIQRLSLSVAIQVDADVLLLDEILAVGDQHFKNKCYDFFDNDLSSETTVVFSSHDTREIERFCPRTLWLDRGTLKEFGDTPAVIRRYNETHGFPLDDPPPQRPAAQHSRSRISIENGKIRK